jgi:hypothetical protein
MENKKEKYSNFDGMTSEIGDDMPWSDTTWSNAKGGAIDKYKNDFGRLAESKCPPGTYGTYPNCFSHKPDSKGGPRMVLSSIDNSTMPDSDQWSNHPGFLGGTWWKDFWRPGEAEKERATEARRSIEGRYPISGSCDLLTATSEEITGVMEKHNKASGKGAKRVAKRELPILKTRLGLVNKNMEVECQAEADEELRLAEMELANQQALQEMQQASSGSSISPTNLILGVVVIGGVLFGMSRLMRPKV